LATLRTHWCTTCCTLTIPAQTLRLI